MCKSVTIICNSIGREIVIPKLYNGIHNVDIAAKVTINSVYMIVAVRETFRSHG